MRIDQYFDSTEVACRCGCGTMPTQKAIDMLTVIRKKYGKPIIINSGARCESHNFSVGGVANSRHLTYRDAFDIQIGGGKNDIPLIIAIAVDAGFRGFGLLNVDNGTLHIDMRDNFTLWEY